LQLIDLTTLIEMCTKACLRNRSRLLHWLYVCADVPWSFKSYFCCF